MNRVNFFDGMEVSAGDLQYAQSALAQQIKDSRTDLMDFGVTSAVDSYVQLDPATSGSLGTPTIRILPFSAYTYTGERIQTALTFGLALDLSDSAGTNNRRLGTQGSLADEDFGWENGATYYICVKYIERGARPKPQEDTSLPYASRVYSGYEFYALRKGVDSFIVDGVNPYIILATATYSEDALTNTKTLAIQNNGITQYATIDGSRVGITPENIVTGSYAPQDPTNNSKVTLSDHIHAIYDVEAVSASNPHGITADLLGIDTESVPTHEKMYHSDGLLASINGIDSTSSALYATPISQVGVVDLLKVYNLQNGEILHYNGKSITYFADKNIIFANIALSDTNGFWPDGIYKLYISTESNNIFISVPSNSSAASRKYTISYDTTLPSEERTPVLSSSIDATKHYLVYSFEFKEEKQQGISGLGVPSNFYSLTDNRTFGSISASNLQVDSTGRFSFPNTFKVNTLQFSDNSVLTSATSLLSDDVYSNCIYSAPNGTFSVSNNRIELNQGLTLLCANGLDDNHKYKSLKTSFPINLAAEDIVPHLEGVHYVFAGKYIEGSPAKLWFTRNYIVSSEQPVSPVSGTVWYNTTENTLRYFSSSWEQPFEAAKIGYVVVNASGNVASYHPDAPLQIVDYSNYKRLIGVDQNCKALETGVLTDNAKDNIINWTMPDYTAGVSKNRGTEYIADTDGIVVFCIDDEHNATMQVLINGTQVFYSGGRDNDGRSVDGTFRVKKGDTYQITGGSNTWFYKFYPLLGAQI